MLGLETLSALVVHGLVDQQADAFGETVVTLLGEELHYAVQEFRDVQASRLIFDVGCVWSPSQQGSNLTCPRPVFRRSNTLWARLRAGA